MPRSPTLRSWRAASASCSTGCTYDRCRPAKAEDAVTLSMQYENIVFATNGGVARLTLSRPDRLNSFNDAMHAEVRDALARVRSDASARVLLLTGAGRAFCAGQDLGDRAVTPGTDSDKSAVDLGRSEERRVGKECRSRCWPDA